MDETTFIEQIKGTRYVNAPGELPPPDTPLDDEVARLRAPPKSIDAEQGVLGALVLDASALPKVSDILATGDFFARSHQLIFDAIGTLVAAGHSVDTLSVFEQLERSGNAGDAVCLAYLNDLAHGTPSAANLRRYAEIVVERSNLRRIIAQADLAVTRAFRCEPASEILADIGGAFGRLAEERKLGVAGLPVMSLAQLREQSHATTWMIKHLLPTECIGVLFGASGTFKSFVAVDMACHVARGMPWLGRRTARGSVVYLAAEGGGGIWKRVCAWHKARKLPWTDTPLHVIPAALDLATDTGRMAEAIKGAGVTPALVVIDTMSQTFGGEENSSTDVAAYFRALSALIKQRWHCAVLVLHHSGHSATERPRGSTAIQANTDFIFGLFRDEKEMLATMTCVHVKDGERFNDATFSLTPQVLGTDADGDEIRSLVARHLTTIEEHQEAMEREGRAGRGGNNATLLKLIQNGIQESDLRQLFYRECGADNADARKKAYQRARSWAINAGLMEVANGWVITLQPGHSSGQQGDIN
ncbi:MAG: hypothetical protein PVS3B2_00140 [Candidatus Dormibacteraceae bacterium]